MADTKTQILLQALKLLQSQGYNATTIAQIAKRLKIKTSGVHYYFPYKGRSCNRSRCELSRCFQPEIGRNRCSV